MKVSFDYDNTLTTKEVQYYAQKLINLGYEVWIVTSRFHSDLARENNWWWIVEQNDKLFKVADILGIRRENIHFTNMKPKVEFLIDKDFIFHLDDDLDQLVDILNEKIECKPINVEHFDWLNTCNQILGL